MDRLRLDGSYKLKYYDHDTFRPEEVMRPDFFPDDWMDTFVPEDVRTALRRNGYIDGHYYGKDLDKERWIDEKDWVYYRSFTVDESWRGRPCVLCLEGVDTVARVYLNGQLLGVCRNMFREYTFDAAAALRIGEENRLAVQVLSPVGCTAHISREGIYPQEDTTRMLLRKSQMNWGWDFCGHCLTAGLWKSVSLQTRDTPRLADARLTTLAISGAEASLRFDCAVADTQAPCEVELELSAAGTVAFTRRVRVSGTEVVNFVLENPRLWWPRPYGEPFLYDVSVRLWQGDTLWEDRRFRFGVRTAELLQEKDEGGRQFLFRINGRRLFIRGANWVPLNCVYGEIKDEDYDPVFARVLDSNLSMLRVWGGGIYEPEHFLDLCDENGIMLFQDMMLACGIFPQDEEFLQQVYEEVGEVVRRYYNRACIVIWSADNELDEAYRWYDKLEEFPTNRVNREAVRRAVEENDSSRPFLVSSPCSPFPEEEGGDDPNSDRQGDMHLYLTRFKQGDEYYYKKILEYKPRFLSEYGFSSLPSEPSYSRFNFYRGTLDLVRNPWLAQLDWMDRLGKTGEKDAIIYYTQFTHAQALKYWIEYLRSLKWHCGGSLYWKFNDPVAPNREDMLFPSLMSSLDFFGLPKMPYYYARRAYEDRVLAFREEPDGSLSVCGCSEAEAALSGTLELRLMDYDGTVLWNERREACLPADDAAVLGTFPAEVLAGAPSCRCYAAAKFTAGDLTLHNIFHLTEIGTWDQVQLPKATLQAEVDEVGPQEYELHIRTDAFAQDVTVEILDAEVYYSDNAFCLEKNGEARVHARLTKPTARWLRIRVRAANAEPVCFGFAPEGGPHEI